MKLLKPLEEADKKLWMDKKHRIDIFKSGLTPNFLVRQYAHAHRCQLARMGYKLMFDGFTDKQATAYLTNALLREAIEMLRKVFISCPVDFRKLRTATTLPRRIPGVEMRYCEEVRQDNLEKLKDYFSKCVALASDLELYSAYGQGNEKYGCTKQQIEQHRKTIMLAIAGFEEALREGFKLGLTRGTISQAFITQHMNEMLFWANVDKFGNLKGGSVSIKELEARIIETGEAMKITSLYKRDGIFTLIRQSLDARRELYVKSAQKATKDPFTTKDALKKRSYSEGRTL